MRLIAPIILQPFRLAACLLAVIMVQVVSAAAPAASATSQQYTQRPKGSLTFNKDIAPLVFARCAGCHRPGQAAPFPLLTYADVRKHAPDIATTTASRFMPPWLPEPGYGTFRGERRLTENELGLLQQWLSEGLNEGSPTDLPPVPQFTNGWTLGQPDLVVTMPQPYALRAEGRDIYRNFVFPIPSSGSRYVRGIEFDPGNPRVVHHAFVNVDATSQSRRLTDNQTPPGFDGMNLPDTSIMPGGHFTGWQPGKQASFGPNGLAWPLNAKTDLVLQLHMHSSGKPETVQPSVGFFFTDQAPTNAGFRINLTDLRIDIPPGATNYTIRDSYTLPVDVEALAVNPHCHYLGKDLKGYAVLPDGTRKWLIWIRDWDFNWQGDYQYARPIELPKGSVIHMEFSYDNSAGNPRNPTSPPRRVQYGLETTDEMGEFWLSVLPKNPSDRAVLGADFYRKLSRNTITYNEWLLQRNPRDAVAQTKVGRAKHFLGDPAGALPHLNAAIVIDPKYDKAHYELGFLYLRQGRIAEARTCFENVIRINPRDSQALGSLGGIYARTGELAQAEKCFELALRLNPEDQIAARALQELRSRPGR